jgi:hypothetical protein
MMPSQFFWGTVVGILLEGAVYTITLVVLQRQGLLNIDKN